MIAATDPTVPAPRIVITGINGAVGSEVAVVLARRLPLAEVVGVFRSEASRDDFLNRVPRSVRALIRPVICDLTDRRQIAALAASMTAKKRTVLVHAAANVCWTASPESAHVGNVETTRNAARLARFVGRTRFLLISSAYTAAENWEYRNNYERSKADAERMLRAEFADLGPAVFSCSLVVGHSRTGEISRFRGIYPLLGLIEKHQPPFLPGNRSGRVDIVPVDWVASELSTMAIRMLQEQDVSDVVAASGDGAPVLAELMTTVVASLNRARLAEGRSQLAEVSVVPFRRWDFLRRSVEAWNVTGISMPNRGFLDRIMAIYGPYFENARVRPPAGVTRPAPPWREYVDQVIQHWLISVGRRACSSSERWCQPSVRRGHS